METATIQRIFDQQQGTQQTWLVSSAASRIQRLKKLEKAIVAHRAALQETLGKELRKPAFELTLHEVAFTLAELRFAIRNLKTWMEPRPVPATMGTLSARSYTQAQPLGVSLVLSPWNYPVQLTLCPVVSAVAAGCCCIVKPSEFLPATSEVLRQIIAAAFTEKEVCVLQGGVELSTALLELPFAHIHFTGSPKVGKIVMAAAAKHLGEVTLELGGKSPCVVDASANIAKAAGAIAFGKFVNAGQTCIAPDYVLVHRSVANELTEALKAAIQRSYYTTGSLERADYARIVNRQHFDRLTGLLADTQAAGATLTTGGEHWSEDLTIAPSILTGVQPDMAIMQEEIFGPLLPILTFDTPEEALRLIRSQEKPLAAYIFSGKQKQTQYYLNNIQAGGITVNDTLLHIANMHLPFGGINNSGIGKTRGYYGFMSFSHERAVVHQGWMGLTRIARPPYARKAWLMRWMKYFLR
jgi:aldehyde dehydrogenase (NAD+)